MDELAHHYLIGSAAVRIPDLTQVPLAVVLSSEVSSQLTNALRRCLEAMLRPGESYAAHSSSP